MSSDLKERSIIELREPFYKSVFGDVIQVIVLKDNTHFLSNLLRLSLQLASRSEPCVYNVWRNVSKIDLEMLVDDQIKLMVYVRVKKL